MVKRENWNRCKVEREGIWGLKVRKRDWKKGKEWVDGIVMIIVLNVSRKLIIVVIIIEYDLIIIDGFDVIVVIVDVVDVFKYF